MIYLDHNATNPPDPRVLEAFRRGLAEAWANPSSLHTPGRRARALLEEARERVAALCGVAPGQVTFTASGTEALNQALCTVAAPAAARAEDALPRIVASRVEHPAVLSQLDELSRAGRADVVLAPVDSDGRVELAALAELLTPATRLCAVMAAQNEVGTLQPTGEVGRICAEAKVPLLVDGSQAVGRLPWTWGEVPWDYLVISGHKLRAPRGAAALVHRGRAPEPKPILLGGAQERGRRGGTESVAACMALGLACELARKGELFDPEALRAKRDAFEALLEAKVPGLTVVAKNAQRLPQTTAILVPGGDCEALLAGLDLAGICASAGSACASGALERSHVLAAMGVSADAARGRLRFSFGPETTPADLEAAASALARLVARP